MITLLPPPGTYGATVVTGWVNTAAERMRAAVVLKAAYRLVQDPSGPHRTELLEGAEAHAIRMSDDGVTIIHPDNSKTFTYRADADIAVEKARTDIVVTGRQIGDKGGKVRVNGTDWLTRIKNAPPAGDSATHLFGWHGRSEPGRKLTDDTWVQNPAAGDVLPPQYSAGFNNFYRRSAGFGAPANTQPLPPGGLVEIHSDAAGEANPLRFRLPTDRFTARIRIWTGHCPDKSTRWAISETVSMSADTLIVTDHPGTETRATLIWRGGWNWQDHPADSYRAVEILREEA